MIAAELRCSAANGGFGNNRPDPIPSLVASAILLALRCSSFVGNGMVSASSSDSVVSSVKPAAYMLIASSTVIPSYFETGLPVWSIVMSLTELHLVRTLLRSVILLSR